MRWTNNDDLNSNYSNLFMSWQFVWTKPLVVRSDANEPGVLFMIQSQKPTPHLLQPLFTG